MLLRPGLKATIFTLWADHQGHQCILSPAYATSRLARGRLPSREIGLQIVTSAEIMHLAADVLFRFPTHGLYCSISNDDISVMAPTRSNKQALNPSIIDTVHGSHS